MFVFIKIKVFLFILFLTIFSKALRGTLQSVFTLSVHVSLCLFGEKAATAVEKFNSQIMFMWIVCRVQRSGL
jgi:hypothetical protein